MRKLLERQELGELPFSVIAEIIRGVFHKFGLPCEVTPGSISWYQSQRGLEWNIVRRRLPKMEGLLDDTSQENVPTGGE